MTLEIASLTIDFGAVVLIWMVQLIIYPSFVYYADKDLLKWHIPYTQRVTFIVAPIMFSQTGIIAYQTFTEFNYLNLLSAVICGSLWLLTFFVSKQINPVISPPVVKLAAKNFICAPPAFVL